MKFGMVLVAGKDLYDFCGWENIHTKKLNID